MSPRLPSCSAHPGMSTFVGTLYEGSPLTGRGHQRLYHTGENDFFGSSLQLIQGFGIEVPGVFIWSPFGSKVADSLSGRPHARWAQTLNTLFLEIVQAFRTDFSFGYVARVCAPHVPMLRRPANTSRTVRHLHGGCSGVKATDHSL